jgi:hypothetical protein
MRQPLRPIDAIEDARRVIERSTKPLLHRFLNDDHAAHWIKAPPAVARLVQRHPQPELLRAGAQNRR